MKKAPTPGPEPEKKDDQVKEPEAQKKPEKAEVPEKEEDPKAPAPAPPPPPPIPPPAGSAAPAPDLADRPAVVAAAAGAPGAAIGDPDHSEQESEEDLGFDNGDQDELFRSGEAMAAAEARAEVAETKAEAAAKRAEEAEAKAEAAESRAAKAEAHLSLLEEELTGMCDLTVKLQKEVKELKQQLEKKKNPGTSGSSSLSPKPAAVPKHPVPVRSAPISALKKPAGPLGEVDSDEDEEQRRLESGSPEAAASNELPRATAAATAEPPATMPPATKPLAAKRPQPSPAPRPPSKSPRLIEKAAAHPSKCYFDGREIDSGEYRCTRDPIVSSSKMRLCSAPSCLAGPDATSAAAFHPFCYFDYYNILGQFSLSGDFTPFQCPACDDPAKSH